MARCCTPLADPTVHPAGFYRGLRLVAVDGSTFELAGDPVIEQEFGRPGGRQGQAGYPQARCVVLAECASHAILGANLGPYGSGEWALWQPLLAHLRAGMLCLADRGFNGFEHWEQSRATGAQLLWRCGATRKLPLERMLDDGSYLSTIGPGGVSVEEARSRAIKVGTDALHRALAAAPGSRATPDPARGLVLRRARPMGPPATAPVRGPLPPRQPRRRARWFRALLDVPVTLRASRTINRSSPRMVKRRNYRYKAFAWGAPRRVPIDPAPQAAGSMQAAPPGRTRLRRAWSPSNPGGEFIV